SPLGSVMCVWAGIICISIVIVSVSVCSLLFFFNASSTTEIYTLSLHDALPILKPPGREFVGELLDFSAGAGRVQEVRERHLVVRSEEHTSELQSRGHLVCRLLLEKKKNRRTRARLQCTIGASTYSFLTDGLVLH